MSRVFTGYSSPELIQIWNPFKNVRPHSDRQDCMFRYEEGHSSQSDTAKGGDLVQYESNGSFF